MVIQTMLLVAAFVLFVIGALVPAPGGRVNLVAVGLACWVAASLVAMLK